MDPELEQLHSKATAPVPEAGRICFDLEKNASYAAAKRGDMPTIKFGKLLRVPTAQLRKMLGLEVA